ncbi:MAG TPA: glycosyltransferase family A protein [Thermoanaerobaculia bacterium]
MNDVTTSFVLPVYNAAEFLPETIESVLDQSDGDLELIVVDDGSSDATPAILSAYALRDPRVRVLTQPNAGVTRALIAGCAAATGKYIARQDAGDFSSPNRLQRQRSALDANGDVVLVSGWTAYVGPELEPLWIARGDGPTHHGCAMFRRDAYQRAGGYRAAFYYGQDWELWYRLLDLGKFQMIEEVLYTARITPGSISASAKAPQEQTATIVHESVRARARGESDAAFVERASRIRPVRGTKSRRTAAPGLYFIGEALRRNGDARAGRYFREAIGASPFYWRAWLRWMQTRFR